MEKRLKIQIKGQKSIKTDIWTNLHTLQCLISTQPCGCAEMIKLDCVFLSYLNFVIIKFAVWHTCSGNINLKSTYVKTGRKNTAISQLLQLLDKSKF